MAAKSHKAPPKLDLSATTFEDWLYDINVWSKLPGDAGSKGAMLYLSLEGKAKDTVRSEVTLDEINHTTDGVKNILNCLKALYKKDESKRQYQIFQSFINFERSPSQSVRDYIVEFNLKYNKVKSATGDLPDALLANRLLEGCKLSSEQKEICNATCSTFNFDNMKLQIERVCIGNQFDSPSSSSKNNLSFKMASLKTEPSDELYAHTNFDQAVDNDVLYNNNRGYNGPRNNWKPRVRWQNQTPNYSTRPSFSGKIKPKMNPLDKFGHVMQCEYCHSICHFISKCPDYKAANVNLCEDVSLNNSIVDDESSQDGHQQHF